MQSYNYKFDNFLAVPEDGDNKLRIYDRNGVLKYTLTPFFNYLYSKNNFVFIKIEDEKEISLDFENENEALRAITKLNQYKKLFVNKKITDTPYYTKEQSDALFLKYLSMSGLTDVNYVNPQVGNILSYSVNHKWELTSYNYFNPTFYYTTAQTYTQYQIINITGLTNYYTAAQIEEIFSGITLSGLSLNSLSDVKTHSAVTNDILFYNGTLWTNTAITSYIYTKPELFNLFIPLSGSSGITGDLIPASDGIYSLGSSTKQWKDIYVSGSTIYLDLKPLKVNSNKLEFNGDVLATNAYVQDSIQASGGSTTLSGLTDVIITSPLNGDIIYFNSGSWYNQPIYNFVYSKSEVYNTGETYTKSEVDAKIVSGGSFDPSQYYTKSQVYNTGQTYNQGEVNGLFNNYYTKSEIDVKISGFTTGSTDLSGYYTSAQTNANFLSANTYIPDAYTKTQSNQNFLSANTYIPSIVGLATTGYSYSKLESDQNFLSANTALVTQLYVDTQDNNVLLSAKTYTDQHSGVTDMSAYYTSAQTNANFLSANTYIPSIVGLATTGYSYSKLESNQNFLSASTNLITQLYVDTQDNNVLLSAKTYTDQQISALTFVSALSALTDVSFNNIQDEDIMIYSASTSKWVNKPAIDALTLFITLSGSNQISGDLTPLTDGGASLGSITNQWKSLYVSGNTIYIDKKPISAENNLLSFDGFALATQNYVDFSAVTSKLSGLTDVDINNVQTGDALTFSGISWINTNLNNIYYTKSQVYNTGETYTKIQVDNIVASGGSFNPALYYTKTDLQNSGLSQINWNNVTFNPFTYKGVVQGGSHVLDSFSSGISFSASWEYSIKNLTSGNTGIKIAYVIACWDNNSGIIEYAETSTKSIGNTSDFDTKYDIVSNGSNIEFKLTSPTDLWDVRLIRRSFL